MNLYHWYDSSGCRATIHLDGTHTPQTIPLVCASLPFWACTRSSSREPVTTDPRPVASPFAVLDLRPGPCQPQGFSCPRVPSSLCLHLTPENLPSPLPALTGGTLPWRTRGVCVLFFSIPSLVHSPRPTCVTRRLLVSFGVYFPFGFPLALGWETRAPPFPGDISPKPSPP